MDEKEAVRDFEAYLVAAWPRLLRSAGARGPDRITGAAPMQALTSDGARIDTVDVAGARGTIYTHPDEATGYELR